MTFTATFTNPTYNYNAGGSGCQTTVPVQHLVTSHEFNAVSAMILYISTDVLAKYDLETDDANNPLQLNSTLLLKRDGARWFDGYTLGKPLFKSYEEGHFLEVTCWGKEGILTQALCPATDGKYTWTLETSKEPVTQLPLKATANYGSFQGDTLWPDPLDATGAKCYIKDASCNSDALDGGIGVGTYAINAVNQGTKTFSTLDNVPDEFVADDTFAVSGSTGNDGTYTVVSATWTGAQTDIVVAEAIPNAVADGGIVQSIIILGATNQGFKPRGWVEIEAEFVYFDGYDDAAADNKYRLRNVKRGELGTAAAAHVGGTIVYEKIAKQIAAGTALIEQDTGTGYEKLRFGKEFATVPTIGCFVLSGTASGTYRGTYTVYDEDSSINAASVPISLDDIVQYIVCANRAYGGAGFSPGVHAITFVNQVGQQFAIAENVPNRFRAGDTFTITDSTGNDGTYTCSINSTWDGVKLNIITVEAIPDATVDGDINITSDLDFSCGTVKVNRYDYDPEEKPRYAFEAINDLIAAVSLENEIKFWYDHHANKFKLEILANSGTYVTIDHVKRIEKEISLEDCFSGVIVAYTEDQDLNRVSPTYAWHTAAFGISGLAETPDRWRRCTDGGPGHT